MGLKETVEVEQSPSETAPKLFKGVGGDFEHKGEENLHIEEIKENGFTLLHNQLQERELQHIREKLDTIYEKQIEEIGEEQKLKEIYDWGSVKQLLVHDEIFLKLIYREEILSIVRHFLGDYFILHLQNGVINRSNEEHPAFLWHRDFPYQNFTSSKPLGINVLHCIDDFTEESGGTFVLPGSHKSDLLPSLPFVKKFEKQVHAKAGSIVIFDPMLFHRAGFNKSPGSRRAVASIFSLPFIKQQISFPRALNGKYKDDPVLRKLLGYDCETADSVLDWRKERLKVRAGTGYTAARKI